MFLKLYQFYLKKPNIFLSKDEKKEIKTTTTKKEQVKEEDKKEEDDKKKEDDEKKEDNNESTKQPTKQEPTNNSMLMISDYYNSSIGNFLMGIGLNRCKEALHKDEMRQTQKIIRKEGERAEYLEELNKQTRIYNECKGANSIFNFDQLKCGFCNFKTESEVVMEGHYSTPHLSNRKEYKCNYCVFITRDVRIIMYHIQVEHKKNCTIQLPPVLYECPTCNYESNQKSKAANHMAKCVKVFAEDKVQQTVDCEIEYPAITPRPISKEELNLYDATIQALKPVAMNSGMQMPNLPSGLPRALQLQMLALLQQQFNQQKLKLNKIAMASKLTSQHNNLKQLQQQQQNLQQNLMSNLLMNNANALASFNGTSLINNLANNLNNLNSNLNSLSNLNNLNSLAKTAPQLYNMLQNGSQLLNNNNKSLSSTLNTKNHLNANHQIAQQQQQQQQKPNIKGFLQNNNKQPIANNNNDLNTIGKAGTFAICEICDGYIKDLEQLRAHMNLIHKVKIIII